MSTEWIPPIVAFTALALLLIMLAGCSTVGDLVVCTVSICN